MIYTQNIQKLIQAFQGLPGVGPKTAQRLAFHILDTKPEVGEKLSSAIKQAQSKVAPCVQCRWLAEDDLCGICSNKNRDKGTICIVSSHQDVLAIENTGQFNGVYFVLSNCLSPLSGLGPEEIGLNELLERMRQTHHSITEIVLALSPTVEGDATCHYISDAAAEYNIQISKIARGVPLGGDLGSVDELTLVQALLQRSEA